MSPGCGAPERPPQRVCFFGTYARQHTATRLLLRACHAAGVEVVECHRPLWEKTRHKHATYFGARSAAVLASQYASAAFALARNRRRLRDVPLYVIGFNGQLDSLWLRLLLRRERTPVVVAPLVTLSETLVDDRQVFRAGSWRARGAASIDRLSLATATRVVMDTDAHGRYVADNFAVPASTISTWHLGTDTSVFAPTPLPRDRRPLRVLFYGSFLPLHGIRTVVEAAARLAHRSDLEFILAGGGPEHATAIALARDARLTRIGFVEWMSYESLAELVASAHICLGIFGTSDKARMVIPNKVYETAARGRPIVTADTPAIREVFAHGETAWLCPAGDAGALAEAIATLADAPRLRQRLAEGAAALLADRFAPGAQGRRLAAIFAAATHHRP